MQKIEAREIKVGMSIPNVGFSGRVIVERIVSINEKQIHLAVKDEHGNVGPMAKRVASKVEVR